MKPKTRTVKLWDVEKGQVLRRFWDLAMDQYLLIPFLGGWTSSYQLFWCSPGVQGFDTLPFEELQRCRDPQLRNSIKPFVELFFFGWLFVGLFFLGPLRSRNITKVEFNIIQLHFHRKPRWKSPFLVELSCWNPIFCWHNVHCCWRHIDVCCQICHSCWQHRIFNFRYKYLLIASNLHFWVNYV